MSKSEKLRRKTERIIFIKQRIHLFQEMEVYAELHRKRFICDWYRSDIEANPKIKAMIQEALFIMGYVTKDYRHLWQILWRTYLKRVKPFV